MSFDVSRARDDMFYFAEHVLGRPVPWHFRPPIRLRPYSFDGQARCSSCGNLDLFVGYGDGDLICFECDEMRYVAVQADQERYRAWIESPEVRHKIAAAMAGYGPFPKAPRRVFPR